MYIDSVGVHIGAGSRQDTLETTGASYLLSKLLSRGTPSRSKADFAQEVEQMGARFGAIPGREQSSLGLQVFKADVGRAVSVLGDAVANASFDPAEVELAK